MLNPEWETTFAVKAVKDIQRSALLYVTSEAVDDPLEKSRFRAQSHLINQWWGRGDFADADHASRAVGMANEFLNKKQAGSSDRV